MGLRFFFKVPLMIRVSLRIYGLLAVGLQSFPRTYIL